MISKGSLHKTKKIYANLLTSVLDQQRILNSGLGEYKNILQWWIPLVGTVAFYCISMVLHTRLTKMISSLIAILPSLTGFLIAAATILISINNDRISAKPKGCNYNYKQVGGAIFFKCIKLALYLLVFSFLTPESLPGCFFESTFWTIPIIKFIILALFTKMIVLMLYGLLFLSSAIES
ncbi:hypothetical protein LPW11_16500 [Geomonas sp. RF6]|uniref:hypothetical protein n=1 Tax=Geomonas sp. RF6 TaxID=2897342 RepID=UPI001E421E37|nr:hypothetical protein [Geomonas sp. RF6]UFS69488.1 hypothetical protein LPW11_16500 [Geomonas sp. RF6]